MNPPLRAPRRLRKPSARGINAFPASERQQIEAWLSEPKTLEAVVGLIKTTFGKKVVVSSLGAYWQRRRAEMSTPGLPSVTVDHLAGGEYKVTIKPASKQAVRILIDILPPDESVGGLQTL